MNQILNLPVAYLLFLGIPLVFVALIAWVYRPTAKKRYLADGDIPFDGDKGGDKRARGGR
jgi:cbb3-type cytochrome oxidase subunit 3